MRDSDAALCPSFVDAILIHARSGPGRPAIATDKGVITYGQVARAIHCASARCERAGLVPGTIAAILVADPVQHLCLVAALHRLGVVSVSVNDRDAPALASIAATRLIHDGRRPDGFAGVAHRVDPDWFTAESGAGGPAGPAFDADAPCMIALSSGTTGAAKPIALSPELVWRRLQTLSLCGGLAQSERIYCGMQLRSLFAFNIAVTALTFGKLVCFAPDDSAALAVMSIYKVDLALLSVYQLDILVDRLRRGQGDLGSLREIQVGGSLTTYTLVTKARAVLSCALVSHYGSSEAGATALAPFARLAAQLKDGAVGFVAPWCRIEIVDDHEQALPLGREGHVRIRGLALAPDYRPGMTRVEPPAFFLPGDHGRLLTGGLLLITGRTSDVLNVGGNKFSPERIEDVVAQCRGVREAAAVVVEFNATIPQVVVAVVADGPVDEADIRRRCADISPLAVPAAIRVVAALPRGPEGKLLREQLRRELTGARS